MSSRVPSEWGSGPAFEEVDEAVPTAFVVESPAAAGDGGAGVPATVAELPESASQVGGEASVQLKQSAASAVSELEQQCVEAKLLQLEYEQERIVERVERAAALFDAELRAMRHERHQLGVLTKHAEMRQVVLFQELVLIRDFEKRENALLDKLNARNVEKNEMQQKVSTNTTLNTFEHLNRI